MIGQALLAKRMETIVTETGAGQHGCYDCDCGCALQWSAWSHGRGKTLASVMNVARMRLLGAKVIAVQNVPHPRTPLIEALRDWVSNVEHHCLLGTGAHPFPGDGAFFTLLVHEALTARLAALMVLPAWVAVRTRWSFADDSSLRFTVLSWRRRGDHAYAATIAKPPGHAARRDDLMK